VSRRRPVSADSSVHPAIWIAAGAAAGLLVGFAVADRAPGSRRLIKGAKALLPALTGLLNLAGRGSMASALPAVADLAASAGAAWSDADDAAEDWDELDEEDGYEDEDLPADALDARVLAAFDADPLLSTLPIEIEQVDEHTIHLDGVVPSARLVQHAVTIARGTPGVERVDHSLTVRRPRQPAAGGRSGR
jgi:hypothetical protein